MASRPTRSKVRVDRLRVKCPTGKIGYATRPEALDGAESAMDAGKVQTGCHLKPYLCDRECGEWHIRNERIVFFPPEDLSRHDYTHRKV